MIFGSLKICRNVPFSRGMREKSENILFKMQVTSDNSAGRTSRNSNLCQRRREKVRTFF